jgi:hypothetical protein
MANWNKKKVIKKIILKIIPGLVILAFLSISFIPVSVKFDKNFIAVSVNYVNASTLTLRPNGNGTYSENEPKFINYTKVDEVSVSDADFVYTPAGAETWDTYALEDSSGQSGAINSVTVYFRGKRNAGTGHAHPRLRLGTTNVDGTQVDVTTSFVTSNEVLARPGGGSWSWSDIDSLQAGVGLYNSSAPYYTACSWLYVVVDYTATPSLTNSPDNKSMGILAASSSYYAYGTAPSNPVIDGDCTFTVTNNGAADSLISIHGHNFTGGVGWTIGSSVGANTIKITCYKTNDNPANGVVLTTSNQTFISSLAASAHTHWDFKLETGTFTDGVGKTGIITLTASTP